MRTVGIVAAVCAIELIFGAAWAGEAPALLVSKPAEIVQGGIAELEVLGAELTAVEGRFGKEKIPFYRDAQGNFA
ncbi:MAG TPA: hypothetical protein VGA09_17000, partial [Candidatus Binatia bacterium]